MQSMTAFARVETQQAWGTAAWEIRSVNHRYLEAYFRLPEAFRGMESECRELLRQNISRGKVECSLNFSLKHGTTQTLQIDENLVKQLISLNASVAHMSGYSSEIRSFDLLKWPQVVVSHDDKASLQEPLLALFKSAIEQLKEHREREGLSCQKVIFERVTSIESHIREIKTHLPSIEQHLRDKLRTRLEALKVEVDANRFEQEVLFYLNRADVAEELDRLAIHCQEVTRTLKQNGSVGRRLDFLMQELNREANTLSSKSTDPRLTQIAVELKVFIEQIREQIQNLE